MLRLSSAPMTNFVLFEMESRELSSSELILRVRLIVNSTLDPPRFVAYHVSLVTGKQYIRHCYILISSNLNLVSNSSKSTSI